VGRKKNSLVLRNVGEKIPVFCNEAFESHMELFFFFLSCSLLYCSTEDTSIIVLKLKATVSGMEGTFHQVNSEAQK